MKLLFIVATLVGSTALADRPEPKLPKEYSNIIGQKEYCMYAVNDPKAPAACEASSLNECWETLTKIVVALTKDGEKVRAKRLSDNTRCAKRYD